MDLERIWHHTGYFGQSATIDRDRGKWIQLSHLLSRKVELHGYWHRQALHQAAESDPKATNYLQTQAVEKEIVAKRQFYHQARKFMPLI